MKIAIDARAYTWAGIGRCIRNLLQELAVHPFGSAHEFIVITGKDNKERVIADLPYDNVFVKEVHDSYYSVKEQTVLLHQLNKIEADLWHFMHFNMPMFFNKPYVVTIHDITRFVFPGQKKQSLWQQAAYEVVFKRAVERAQAVVAASETTEHELWQLPLKVPSNTVMIRWGLEKSFSRPVAQINRQKIRMLLDTDSPYLLFVGVWMNHKNLPRLFQAFKVLSEKHINLKLVVTGKPVPGYNNMVSSAKEMGILDKVIFPGYVPEELLTALYAESSCLVFPSLYEGFGFPTLEAAACGTPVVTSNVSCMPEIMKEAAEYVNPEYVPDIVRGVDKVLSDKQRSMELIDLGKHMADRFDWEKVAKRYLEVYKSAAVKSSI